MSAVIVWALQYYLFNLSIGTERSVYIVQTQIRIRKSTMFATYPTVFRHISKLTCSCRLIFYREAIFISAITLLIYSYKHVASFPFIYSFKVDMFYLKYKACTNTWFFLSWGIALRHHQERLHVTVAFEGIRITVQYQGSVLIWSDTCTLAPRILTNNLNLSIYL